jgi:hypothetical protein
VTARGKRNSVRVEFEDGYVMITSGNALRRIDRPGRGGAGYSSVGGRLAQG